MLRFSLKQLLALVTLSALAVVSLKYASVGWLAAIGGLAMILLFAAVVVAVVDRGARQAFGLGATIVILIYGLLIVNNTREMNGTTQYLELLAGRGGLPTSRVLNLFNLPIEPAIDVHPSGPRALERMVREQEAMLRTFERMNLAEMQHARMQVGHLWFALLFAYCGGHFARFVDLRRIAEQTPAEKGD